MMNWYKKAQTDDIDEDLLSALQETLTEEKDRLNTPIDTQLDAHGKKNLSDGSEYERDKSGRIIWRKTPDGREYKYNEKGIIIWKKYPDGSEYNFPVNM